MAYGLEFWAITFDFVGKILIATTALLAHRIIVREKGIDKIVLKDMKLEISTGVVAIIFLIIGYVLHFIVFSR